MQYFKTFIQSNIIVMIIGTFLLSLPSLSEAKIHQHEKEEICEDYVRGLYAGERREFEAMHKAHVKQMEPYYEEYKKLEKRNPNSKRTRDFARRIKRMDREFARQVSKKFDKIIIDGEKVVQHGRGLSSPCGYSGY